MNMADAQKPVRASALQAARAVFWSFLGIRRRAEYEKDAVALTPLQVIIAGIVGAVIFVVSLIMLVRFVTS